MHCPRCQHENPSGQKFCGECGVRLAAPCSACGASNPPDQKFCGECGTALTGAATPRQFGTPESYTPKHLAERILTSKTALEGERKQVTVLFADLKGSMELLADRDPEEARKILDPVLEHMMEAVHRYEGTVNQVMGDGIMALFGAPIAHEDHAVRACYAALRMQEAVKRYAEDVHRTEGAPIQIRVGLNSGDVVVRSIGSDLRMDYTALGQTTHLAARMEQLAMPGSILITPETLALAEGYVVVKSLGPRPIRGLQVPLEVYEIVGAATVRSRFQAAASRGLTRFVGRETELDQLHQALGQAHAGRGQVVAVVGEPGIGKSRLYWEFTHSHRTHGWLTIEAGSVSYGKATSYLPVVELLRAYFQIEAGDGVRKITEKVTGKLLSLDRTLETVIPPLLWLLDVAFDDESWARRDAAERRRQTLDGVKRLLLRESQAQSLIVVFEDLHWIDPETQALLDSLVESLPTARMLLLVNYRPEYQHAWSSKTYYRLLRIDPLPQIGSEALLEALLGTDVSLRPLKDLLVARTEGNPFFLEESVRTLVETKILVGERGAYRLTKVPDKFNRTLQIPATARALLAARIDRLSSEDKRLLQAASVIGTDVPFDLLQAIMDEAETKLRQGLTRLQAAEFLYETRLFPELEYTFKHALTHEVTYGTLLHERRRALHARIVEAIEYRYADRLTEQAERLAHHAVKGQLGEKAVHYLRQAGLKAAARSALQDARLWFEQALGVLEALPESPSTLEQGFETRLELRPVLNQLGEVRRVLERLREAEALAERLNDERRRGRAGAFVTMAHNDLGELDDALVNGACALAIAGRLGDLRLRILTTSCLAEGHYYRGDYERVVELATDNLAALPADWVSEYFGMAVPASVLDRSYLAMSLAQLGRFAEAAEHEAEAIRLAEPTRHAHTVGWADLAAGTLRLLKGDWSKARALIEHWIAVVRTGNVAFQLPPAVVSSAWALAQLGEASEALNRLREAEPLLERQAARGLFAYRGWDYHSLGRAALRLGRLDEARRLGDRAVESSPGHHGFAAHALHLLGDIATHPDRFDAQSGEADYREALALAEPRGMRPLVAHCHLGLGKLYHRTGDRAKAEPHLTTARAMYREMDMAFYLAQADAELSGVGR
jgi:class 3 adenylate cyclase/tetratricopeptide (TPR) repeat protein